MNPRRKECFFIATLGPQEAQNCEKNRTESQTRSDFYFENFFSFFSILDVVPGPRSRLQTCAGSSLDTDYFEQVYLRVTLVVGLRFVLIDKTIVAKSAE